MVALVDKTFADLKRLVEIDLGNETVPIEDARRLLDWFHFRARMIACRPRRVSFNAQVSGQSAAFPAISRIAQGLQQGVDMSPWLSDRVRLRKSDHRADMMFNDWQISHFHLGSHFITPNKVSRTGPLLFAYIDNKEAVFLKAEEHGAWTDEDILFHLLETRPELIEQYEFKGVLPPRQREELSSAQKNELRSAGVNTAVVLKGRTFVPFFGVVSSGHAGRLVIKSQRFLRAMSKLRADIRNDSTGRETRSALAFPIGVPVSLRVKLEENGDLLIYDEMRSLAFFRERAPA